MLLVFYGATLPDHPRKWWLHEKLRWICRVTVDKKLDVLRKGLHWRLNPADYTDSSLFWLNSRDDWDIFHLKRLLIPESTILDVGANFGYYSLILAAALRMQCRILACEPDRLNFERLKKHVAVNNMGACVQLSPMGVSDREEIVRMHRPGENSGHSMVDSGGEYGGIRLTTMNRLCKDKGIDQLDLMILDVEGFELKALQGSGALLLRFTPMIFVELFPPVMHRQNARPEEVVAFLEAKGYSLFVARKDRLIPLMASPSGDQRENVFAFHEKHFVAGIAPSILKGK